MLTQCETCTFYGKYIWNNTRTNVNRVMHSCVLCGDPLQNVRCKLYKEQAPRIKHEDKEGKMSHDANTLTRR